MDVPKPVSSTSTRFMDRVTVFIRSRGLAYRTEKTYCLWIKRFIKYHGYSSPDEMQPIDIEPFLSHLAIERSTAVNTQRTALNALVFLFREFLKQEIGELEFQQANKPRKLPTVLSQDEAKEPLNNSPRALRELKRSATRRTSQRNGRSPCQEVQRRGRTFWPRPPGLSEERCHCVGLI